MLSACWCPISGGTPLAAMTLVLITSGGSECQLEVLPRTISSKPIGDADAWLEVAVERSAPAIAASAIACLSGAMDVSVGVVYNASSVSSHPTTATSSGTRNPSSWNRFSSPTAIKSLQQNTASTAELVADAPPVVAVALCRFDECVGWHEKRRSEDVCLRFSAVAAAAAERHPPVLLRVQVVQEVVPQLMSDGESVASVGGQWGQVDREVTWLVNGQRLGRDDVHRRLDTSAERPDKPHQVEAATLLVLAVCFCNTLCVLGDSGVRQRRQCDRRHDGPPSSGAPA